MFTAEALTSRNSTRTSPLFASLAVQNALSTAPLVTSPSWRWTVGWSRPGFLEPSHRVVLRRAVPGGRRSPPPLPRARPGHGKLSAAGGFARSGRSPAKRREMAKHFSGAEARRFGRPSRCSYECLTLDSRSPCLPQPPETGYSPRVSAIGKPFEVETQSSELYPIGGFSQTCSLERSSDLGRFTRFSRR